ncbi:sugar transporter domain-containing protein [Sarocladium implicatum]|nr:sugar transporter domain-containing protein [Sarocladium implicatum]
MSDLEHRETSSSKPEIVAVKEQALQADHNLEHETTVKQVFRNHPQMVWWCFYWAMASVGWGFDAQVNGGMLAVRSFRRDFGYYFQGEPVLPAPWQSAFNAISSVGQFGGGFLCSWLADHLGRKKSLAIGVVICTGGIFGEVFSTTRVAFLLSKLILGVGLGFYLTIAPLATSEMSPVVFRGIATMGVQFGIGSGQLLSNAAIKGFGEWDSRWAYRAPFALQLFFCVFLAAGLPFAPESPWWLARAGKRDLAKKALRQLYGPSIDVDAKLMVLEATIIEEEAAKTEQGSVIQCWRGTNLIRTSISIGIFLCQHFTGIIFALGYSSYFFQLAGLDVSKSFDLGVGVTAAGVSATIISWFFIERLGRRTIFLSGMFSLTVVLVLIGILDVIHTGAAKWVQASLTIVYAFIYFATLGAMAFAILGEVSSTVLRAPTIAIATATQAAFGTLFNSVIPYMINPDEGDLKGKVGFIFGGLSAIASLWAFVFVPELKGRRFDEIDQMFQDKVPPRKMGSHVVIQ